LDLGGQYGHESDFKEMWSWIYNLLGI